MYTNIVSFYERKEFLERRQNLHDMENIWDHMTTGLLRPLRIPDV